MKKRIKQKTTFEFFMSSRKCAFLRHLMIQIMVFFLSLNAFGTSSDIFVVDEPRLFLWLIFYGMLNVVCYLNMYLLVPKLFLKNKIYQYILCIVAEVIVFLFMLLFAQPTEGAAQALPTTPVLMVTNLISSFINICIVVISSTTLLLFHYWIQEQNKARELKTATRNAELEFLKSQINPHFLFNTLNNANVLLHDRGDEASMVLLKLEDLIRYQLKECSKDSVMLKDDIHFLNDYLNLEKIRRDKFDFTCTAKGKIDNIIIPPLMFIPFVENAVKHNPDSGARIDMWFIVENNNLEFICDNMKSQDYVKSKVGGIGLANIQRRLELLYPNRHNLQIIDSDKNFKIILTTENLINKD